MATGLFTVLLIGYSRGSMSRMTFVLVALIAFVGIAAAEVQVSISVSTGMDSHFGRFGTAGVEDAGSLESVMSYDMSGDMVDYFGHQDIVSDHFENHMVLSVVDGHQHSSGWFRIPYGTFHQSVDGDVVTGSWTLSQ